jgi:ABC-type antimicrobial peptide transport system permease subunit
MNNKLNILVFSYALAIVSALGMFLLGIAGNIGIYEGAVKMMEQWHMFFSLSVGGIIAGMIEAAIISFFFGYVFAWVYNKTLSDK